MIGTLFAKNILNPTLKRFVFESINESKLGKCVKRGAGFQMEKEVAVLDTDKKQCKSLCDLLTDHEYISIPMTSLTNMDQYLGDRDCRAIILNLDNVSVTNKSLKLLKRKKPSVSIIAFSERQFHPELEEALREYISVCLAKPVDPDELTYWLKTIYENNEKPI